MTLRSILTVVLCFTATTLAYADTLIYKWIDKEGAPTFSQSRPAGVPARDITTITVESMPIAKQRAANRLMVTSTDTDEADFAAHQNRLKRADHKIDIAIKKLTEAEQNLTEGSIPTGFDRVGNVGGHARLRESYFERVANLQYEVDQARKKVNDAFNERDQAYSRSPK
jgi:flagellar motility protein MotE (MotC chaperone)